MIGMRSDSISFSGNIKVKMHPNLFGELAGIHGYTAASTIRRFLNP